MKYVVLGLRYLLLRGFVFLCLAGSVATPAIAEGLTSATSFDEFIDQSVGDEVRQSEVVPYSAYRAKRVTKTLFRWIDKQGYYNDFIGQFKQWCAVHSGRYVKKVGLDADCFDGEHGDEWLGAYRIDIKATATYQGDMTAGYATFFFFRNQEMMALRGQQKSLADEKDRAILADNLEKERQYKCQMALANIIQTDPKPGTKTNLGMIVESKPPLAFVQNLSQNPPTRWVEISLLGPPEAPRYCQ